MAGPFPPGGLVVLRAAGRNDLANLLVKGDQADRVLLAQEQVTQAGGDGAGIVVLVEGAATVVHGFTHVHDHGAAQIRLFLILLDVIAIRLRPHLPVEVAQVVPRHVLAMLDELDAVPEERALVHAGDEPFHDMPGTQIEPGDAGDGLGMQKPARVFFFGCQGKPSVGRSVVRSP